MKFALNLTLTFAFVCLHASPLCAAPVAETPTAETPSAGGYEGKPADLHIYLLIGQSNMAGRAAVAEKEQGPIKNAYLLNDADKWVPASNPLNRFSTIRKGLGMQKLNPGTSFAKALLTVNPNVSIGLVVNAKGGSKIEQWEASTKFYTEAVRRLKEAGKTGTIKGVLWHQGESNSAEPAAYLPKLESLVRRLRQDLEMPDLPFVAGQIKEGHDINAEIAKLPTKLDHTAYASSAGLKTYDRWHFDSASMQTLGQRYAEKILELQQVETE